MPDEEIGGHDGMEKFVKDPLFKELNIGWNMPVPLNWQWMGCVIGRVRLLPQLLFLLFRSLRMMRSHTVTAACRLCPG